MFSKLALALLIMVPALGSAKVVEVKMLNTGAEGTMIFEPSFVKVAVGDTVKFVPTDAGHMSASIFTPAGGATWKSGYQGTSVKITKEGVYFYECTPHAMMGMIGVIQAGKAVNAKAIKAKITGYKAKVMMNKNRVDTLLKKIK